MRYPAAMESESSAEIVEGEMRGILLAVELLGADEAALQALDEQRRESCARAWRTLCALDEPARARTIAAWRAEAASALPAGLSRLHPSWIEEALAGERTEVVAAIRPAPTAARAIREETARELARLAFGRLAPLCESTAGSLGQSLCDLEFEELLSEVTRRGARVVGRSLAGAAPSLRARAMASAGEPWAQDIAAASLATVSSAERAAATVDASAPAASEGRTARERMLAIGLASLKAELKAEGAGSPFRVAGRLPAPLGRSLVGW
jgi:hypothetical protein